MLGLTLRQPAWSILAGILMPFQAGLMWRAARTIDSKPAPLVIVLLGPVVVGLGNVVPVLQDATGSLSLIVGAHISSLLPLP